VPAPRHWFVFLDPPQHTTLRALISRASTPRTIGNLEPEIHQLSRELLAPAIKRGEVDLVAEYSGVMPMMIISRIIGIPAADWARFRNWSDIILKLSYARSGGAEAEQAGRDFTAVTLEMNGYLTEMIAARKSAPRDDLLTRLVAAEVDGERLSQEEILGFFQLLIVGGQETTTNLINNAVLCLLDNPEQLAMLRAKPSLLPLAIEEVLRYRAPFQWVMRTPKRDLQMHGQTIAAGKLVLPMIGSANRDARVFKEPERFNIAREPNPHVGFGHGIHACLGAALARMESRIALTDLLTMAGGFERISNEPWLPRNALHVHGPAKLEVRFLD
jgi:cytochrome P450